MIFWLWKIGHKHARSLVLQILLWLAFLFNHGPWLNDASSNALMIPLLQGNKRLKRVPANFKDALARAGAEGTEFTSGHHVVKTMRKLNMKQGIDCLKSSNRWIDEVMARYLNSCRMELGGPHGRVISIAWDGTRLSLKEYLFAVMYANGKACITTPIVPSRTDNCMREHLAGPNRLPTVAISVSLKPCLGTTFCKFEFARPRLFCISSSHLCTEWVCKTTVLLHSVLAVSEGVHFAF